MYARECFFEVGCTASKVHRLTGVCLMTLNVYMYMCGFVFGHKLAANDLLLTLYFISIKLCLDWLALDT